MSRARPEIRCGARYLLLTLLFTFETRVAALVLVSFFDFSAGAFGETFLSAIWFTPSRRSGPPKGLVLRWADSASLRHVASVLAVTRLR